MPRTPAPGPPRELQFTNRSQTMLNISWLEPEERNGHLLWYRLSVSSAEGGSGRRRRGEAADMRTFDVRARQRDSRNLDGRHADRRQRRPCSVGGRGMGRVFRVC